MTFPTTHPALARALAARDYSVPTAVQLAVLDANAASRDLLVSAQTGSGKTVAFGLAIAKTLLGDAERFETAAEPMALIIAPTRELAMQVQQELVWLYAETGARIITCVGGMDARAEARQLSLGAHIVVGTPGRLRDHQERRRLDLSKLRTIVLDEADEMLDLGFREDLEFILDATPQSRQTLLFSATMPREIEALARRYQRDAVRIETIRRDEQHADIEYRAFRVAGHDIENAVVNVLRFHEARATLVFCATREAVKRLHARLMERGFSAVALSGELTQHERTQALQALRDGRARVLVATDVAARGLDLPDLALVIHADLPNDGETLLHRSGRTGRAGKKGLCTLIVPYNRRRKAEDLLNAARVKVTWGTAPTADEIRARDQERFLADAIFTDPAADEELALARGLQAARSSDEIALALVRIHRTRLPAPEDLAEDTGPPRRDNRVREGGDRPRPSRFERQRDDAHATADRSDAAGERGGERGSRTPRPRREDTREMVWFRLNIGRERNADPRWLVPLICKAGGITKAEIGTITINDRDTRFQIVAGIADQFADAARTNKNKEGHISRVGAYTVADDAAVADAIKAIPPPKASVSKASVPKAITLEAAPASAGHSQEAASRTYTPKARPSKYVAKGAHHSVSPNPAPSAAASKPTFTTTYAAKPAPAPHTPGGRPKAPWHDRKKSNAGGQPYKGPRTESKTWNRTDNKTDNRNGHSPQGSKSRGTWAGAAGSAGPGAAGAAKPASKYAHKKKHRPTGPPATNTGRA